MTKALNEFISNEEFDELLGGSLFLSSSAVAGYCNIYSFLTRDMTMYIIVDDVINKKKKIIFKQEEKKND